MREVFRFIVLGRILPARIVLSVRYQIMVGIAKIRKSKGGKKAKAESGIPV
jgi:hypothetical protein